MTIVDWVLLAAMWVGLPTVIWFAPGTAFGYAASFILWTVNQQAAMALFITTTAVWVIWHYVPCPRITSSQIVRWLYHHPPVIAIGAAAVAIVTGPDWVSLTGYLALVAVALWLALRRAGRPAVEVMQQPVLEHQPRVVLTRTTTVVETAAIEQSSPIDRLPPFVE